MYHYVPKFTISDTRKNIFWNTKMNPNLSRYTQIYQHIPKYITIYKNISIYNKYTKIYHKLPKFYYPYKLIWSLLIAMSLYTWSLHFLFSPNLASMWKFITLTFGVKHLQQLFLVEMTLGKADIISALPELQVS